jgi:predicted CoA-substrate-specific enzyme activase
MSEKLFLGIDIGSVSVNLAILNEKKEILKEEYIRHMGQPVKTALEALKEVEAAFPVENIWDIGVTGSGGKLIVDKIKGTFVNEVVAQAKAVELFHPNARTIIEIGGEDSKLILVEYDKHTDTMMVKDFAMNTICAAGTGSFLDQQATRLGFTIEQFGEESLKSKTPPRIAGRCSVFAKTDMIHLQQEATPVYDIISGLCFAMARNFRSSIGKGKDFVKPVVFQGGVAASKGMIRAFRDVLGLIDGELIVPEHFSSMPAIGVALLRMTLPDIKKIEWNLSELSLYLESNRGKERKSMTPLSKESVVDVSKLLRKERTLPSDEKLRVYLGIDIGSISTNVVAIDEDSQVVARSYLRTAGRPIEAVRQGIREVGSEIKDHVIVAGVGTTGSGRYMIGDLIGADAVRNEITAQATATAHYDPDVDTIFEIGGQDSKYISLANGAIVDFEMNKVCAAGTGSFLEEQAERLDVNIKGEFSDVALSSECPSCLGERCTVFMESDVVHNQQLGVEKADIVAGLSYSIAQNYLNRVVGERKIGNKIYFQGAVANNQGVKAAFESVLGKSINIPPNFDVTGAIGAAILAREYCREEGITESRFKGFDLVDMKYEISSFECKECSNLCEIRKVTVEDGQNLFYGSRCEKFEIDKIKKKSHIPDYFKEREHLLTEYYEKNKKIGGKKIGFPRILTMYYEMFPFWSAFFTELGFEIVLSDVTTKKIIHMGVENAVAETCFPVKVALGHVYNIMDKHVDYLFLPSLINMKQNNPNLPESFSCPYVQSIPYTLRSAINFEAENIKVLEPALFFKEGYNTGTIHKELIEMGKILGLKGRDIKIAVKKAADIQDNFYKTIQARGKGILEKLQPEDRAVIVVSRPYNGCDPGVNLGLPQKLMNLGVIPIPLDFFPVDEIDISEDWPNMYWRYGQKILCISEIIRKDKRLNALYLTNFGCGPDSFITHFFRKKMDDKPFLQIEIDEHSADVGAITRCEAFLDSIKNVNPSDIDKTKQVKILSIEKGTKKTVYLPYMSDHAHALAAAFKANGVNAVVMPESNEETVKLGRRYTSGKECYPAIVTTGDMVRQVMSKGFDRKGAAFFMGGSSGPCRFGQYNMLQRMVLDEIGYEDVPIYAPNQAKNFFEELEVVGKDFFTLGWQGMVTVDLLEKCLRETRPYEINKGETEKVYEETVALAMGTIEKRGNLIKALKECRKLFETIKVNKSELKPVVGMVGEFFVRANRFSNEDIVLKLEELGVEVWVAPVYEWFLYRNFRRDFLARQRGDIITIGKTLLMDKFQVYEEHKIAGVFKGFLRNLEEPSTKSVLDMAEEYVSKTFFGEAIMSMGKAVDFYNKGLCGIVNTIPFTCLPGTIAAALLKRFKEEHNDIPVLNVAYDGLGQTNSDTRLEAFVHQAKQFRKRMETMKKELTVV